MFYGQLPLFGANTHGSEVSMEMIRGAWKRESKVRALITALKENRRKLWLVVIMRTLPNTPMRALK